MSLPPFLGPLILLYLPQTLHVWHIYLHWGGAWGVFLGRQSYGSPMECLVTVPPWQPSPPFPAPPAPPAPPSKA